VVALAAKGVPVMTPLANERPAGSAGVIDHAVTVPVTVGVLGAMAVPTMQESGLVLYIKLDGAVCPPFIGSSVNMVEPVL
jgi:hypothetical protein